MTYTAQVKRFSRLWHTWHNTHRVSGVVCGVPFVWQPGNEYVSANELTPVQIADIKGHSDVQLVAIAAAMPVAELAFEPMATPVMPQRQSGNYRRGR